MRILAVLPLLLLLSCKQTPKSVVIDPGLLTQVPEQTVALGALRVKAMRDTPAWKRLLSQPVIGAQFDKLAQETSFDPRKDLWELLWSSDGTDSFFYARGEFAPMGLEPKMRDGTERTSHKGQMLIGNEEGAVWFVNSSTAVFGRTEKIKALIDSRDTRKAGPPASLRLRLEQIPPNAHIWSVAEAAYFPNFKAESNLPTLLRSVQGVNLSASLAEDVKIEASASCADEKGAKMVHDSLRGLMGLARLSLPAKQKQILLPVLDAARVEIRGNDTLLHAPVTAGQLEALQAMLFSLPESRRQD
ncbi:MAG: hypothetical protein FJW30_22105 [Acidobacteria bacterium]|nr:hypothetical protein [Acidobacteriota bacterium]